MEHHVSYAKILKTGIKLPREQIYGIYNEFVRAEVIPGRILKMDVYNEKHTDFRDMPFLRDMDTTYIEYDEASCEYVQQRFPELAIIHGDIRNMPFPDNDFQNIVDMSTIDHIHPEDVLRTLQEYRRVLDGKLIMVAWCREGLNPKGPWRPENQYYLGLDALEALYSTFDITLFEPFHYDYATCAWLVKICGIT